MKTTNFMMAASAILISVIIMSCTKEFEQSTEIEVPSRVDTFIANVETIGGTKTSLGAFESSSYSLVWNNGDRISVSDGASNALYTTSSNGTTSAAFEWTSGKLSTVSETYTAFYPSSITLDNMVLPSEQEYVEDNINEFPMYAQSTDRSLQFKNLCGIVRLDIIDDDESADYSVSAINLSCDGMGMSGQFTIGGDNAAVVSGEDGVSLVCKTSQALGSNEARSFNITVPAGNYENMTAEVEFSDGSFRTYQANGTAKVKRSCITRYSVSVKASDFSGTLELIPVEDGDVDFTER